ncbi:MAG: glycosyltransferase family 39 protein, partial [Candidatus Methylomirabilis sp.]|nr:glycosyltransferase family 39 protein [Deltaproteobacteria bacterium]
MNDSVLSPRSARLLLLLCLLAGGLLRFWHITERGPFVWDEGIYHQEGTWIYSGLGNVADSLRLRLEERRTGRDLWKADEQFRALGEKADGVAVWSARPARVWAIGLTMFLTGNKPWVGPLLSAVYGVALILLVHHIAARWWGRDAAVASAAALAVMGWHVLYSREGFLETDSILVLGASIWFFCESAREGERRPWLRVFLAGLLWGVGITVQVRWASLFPMLLIGEALHWLHARRPLREHFGRVLVMTIAAGLPLLAFELPYYPIHILAREFDAKVPFMTYLQQVVVQALVVARSAKVDQIPSEPFNWLNFPYSMLVFSGPAMLALAAVGLVAGLVRSLPPLRRPLHEQHLLVERPPKRRE